MTEPSTSPPSDRITVLDRSELGKLALVGPDAKGFLDGQVSNAILELAPGRGLEAALLTPKGKLLALVRVLDLGEELHLTTDRATLQALFDRLRTGSIGWQVELQKRTLQQALVAVGGPGARALVGAPDELHAHAAGPFGLAIATPEGAEVLLPAEEAPAVLARLHEAGAVPADEAALEVARVERGDPRWGVDLDETVIPQEAGLNDRVVSFTKACYVGQETIARLHWKGRPNRHLRGLRLTSPVAPGTAVRLGDRDVGTVTSSVVSAAHGPIALAMLRREAEPGAEVQAGQVAAVVADLPFG